MAKTTEDISAQQLVEMIADENSFVKTYALFKGDTVLGEAFGEGVVSGFATLNDIAVGIFAIDGNTLKGAIGAKNGKKIVDTVFNCIKTKTPLIGVIDTSGARFTEGVEVLESYADILKSVSLAREEIPVMFLVSGNCYGSLSYILPMADVCLGLKNAGVATSSPLIIASKTNLDVDKVCSADARLHNGIFDKLCDTPQEAREYFGKYLSYFDEDEEDTDDLNRECAIADGDDVYKAVEEIFDRDSFFETKTGFSSNVVTGFAKLGGETVGIVGFKGEKRLDTEGARKIRSLRQICSLRDFPLVNLVDCVGIVNKLEEEHGDIIGSISSLFDRNIETSLTVSLIVGKAIGIGYTAFAAKKNYCDYVMAFENAYIGALDGEATAALLYEDQIKKAKDPDKALKELAESYKKENCLATKVGESGFIDNVVPEKFARKYLAAVIQYMR